MHFSLTACPLACPPVCLPPLIVSFFLSFFSCCAQLQNGQLVVVPSSLIKRLNQHYISLPWGIDLILGRNGFIWITREWNPLLARGQTRPVSTILPRNRSLAVLCCAVLCCAVLCCAVRCWLIYVQDAFPKSGRHRRKTLMK